MITITRQDLDKFKNGGVPLSMMVTGLIRPTLNGQVKYARVTLEKKINTDVLFAFKQVLDAEQNGELPDDWESVDVEIKSIVENPKDYKHGRLIELGKQAPAGIR